MKKIIFDFLKMNLEQIELAYKLSLEYGLTDTQEFINWQDKLNEYSTK